MELTLLYDTQMILCHYSHQQNGLLIARRLQSFLQAVDSQLSSELQTKVGGLWREVSRDPRVLQHLLHCYSQSEVKGDVAVKRIEEEAEELFRLSIRARPFEDEAFRALANRPFSEGLSQEDFLKFVPLQARRNGPQEGPSITEEEGTSIFFKTVAMHSAARRYFEQKS